MSIPKIAIVVKGGMVQSVIGNELIEVVVLESDTDGSDYELSTFEGQSYIALATPVEVSEKRTQAAFSTLN